MNDDDFILVEYMSGNKGEHAIIGVAEFDRRIAKTMVRRSAGGGWLFRYGTAGGRGRSGDRFLVHKRDVELAPNLFRPIETMKQTVRKIAPLPQREAPPPPVEMVEPEIVTGSYTGDGATERTVGAEHGPLMPKSIEELETTLEETGAHLVVRKFTPPPFDPQLLPGVTPKIAEQMKADGIQSAKDVLARGIEGLTAYRGVGQTKAKIILGAVGEMLAEA